MNSEDFRFIQGLVKTLMISVVGMILVLQLLKVFVDLQRLDVEMRKAELSAIVSLAGSRGPSRSDSLGVTASVTYSFLHTSTDDYITLKMK